MRVTSIQPANYRASVCRQKSTLNVRKFNEMERDVPRRGRSWRMIKYHASVSHPSVRWLEGTNSSWTYAQTKLLIYGAIECFLQLFQLTHSMALSLTALTSFTLVIKISSSGLLQQLSRPSTERERERVQCRSIDGEQQQKQWQAWRSGDNTGIAGTRSEGRGEVDGRWLGDAAETGPDGTAPDRSGDHAEELSVQRLRLRLLLRLWRFQVTNDHKSAQTADLVLLSAPSRMIVVS